LPQRSHRHAYTVLLSASLTWLAPASATAWCRASDEVADDGSCVPAPNAPFLFWKRSCVSYQFNDAFFRSLAQRLNETEIRSAFEASFDAWAAVDCDGRGSFFVEQLASTTPIAASAYDRNGPNQMVVLALSPEQWSELPDHSERAIAMTLMWHSKKTGEILDSDMELNLGAGVFADCVASPCDAGMIDLRNTITHEAGHVLGLGHSTDTSSTMAAQTVGAVDTQKRTLAADDEAGYCALMLPEWTCTNAACSCEPPVTTSTPALQNSAGCQLAATHGPAPGWPWLLAAGVVLSRLRRRGRGVVR
jgi:hypothetical protein